MTEERLATERQKRWIGDLGVEKIPDDLALPEASKWIEELRIYSESSQRGTIQREKIRTDLFSTPPGRSPRPAAAAETIAEAHKPGLVPPGTTQVTTTAVEGKAVTASTPVVTPENTTSTVGPSPQTTAMVPPFRPANELQAGTPAPRTEFPAADDEERGMKPVQDVPEFRDHADEYFKDLVLKGRSERIFTPLGIPAKWVVCRVSRDKKSGAVKAISYHPMVQGLQWFADNHHKGVVACVTQPVSIADVEGLAAWEESQNDPRIVFRAEIKTGDRRHSVAYGTARASEIVRGRYTFQPAVTSNPTEMAETRAISRALRHILSIYALSAEELTPEMISGREPLSVAEGENHAALPEPRPHRKREAE